MEQKIIADNYEVKIDAHYDDRDIMKEHGARFKKFTLPSGNEIGCWFINVKYIKLNTYYDLVLLMRSREKDGYPITFVDFESDQVPELTKYVEKLKEEYHKKKMEEKTHLIKTT
ncbi:MAG: hypothetical protein Q8J97_00380 [Flavobacteriaceae bacterium]|nr:hypothetical protein [Flavobacteriaceae bacterium]